MTETSNDYVLAFDEKVAALQGEGREFQVVPIPKGTNLRHPAGPANFYIGQLKPMSGGGRGCVVMVDYLSPKGPRCLLQAVPSRR